MTAGEGGAPTPPAWKLVRVRHAGQCARCGVGLPQGVDAYWSRAARTLRCSSCYGASPSPVPTCPPIELLQAGEAGRSADREWQRRRDKRREQTLRDHPRVGRLLLAIGNEPQSTTAWRTGAAGERRVAEHLASIRRDDVIALHDRRVPAKLSNLDHIVVGPSGVYVVDSKNYDGRVEVRDKGSFFAKDPHLFVGGRDRSKDAAAMGPQIEVVARVLRAHDIGDVPVHAVLCFVACQWPLLGRPREFAGVRLARPEELAHIVSRSGPLEGLTVRHVAGLLDRALRPA